MAINIDEKKGTSSPEDLSLVKFLEGRRITRARVEEWLGTLKSDKRLDWHVMEHRLFNVLIEAVSSKR